jgi:hypothetical protein
MHFERAGTLSLSGCRVPLDLSKAQRAIATAAISLVLCATSLPGAVMGLAIDVVVLVLLAIWPWQFVGRPGRVESA